MLKQIHKARWTSIKIAYLICRYYPILAFPFYLWAWLGDYPRETCEKVVHPLYGMMVVFSLSAQVVILIRSWAFAGRNPIILGMLVTCFIILAGAEIWLFGTNFVVVKELYLLLGDSACFANDGLAQAGGPYEYLSAFPTAVSSPVSDSPRDDDVDSLQIIMLGAFFFDLLMMLIVIVYCIRIRSVRGRLGKTFLFQGFSGFVVISSLNLMTACLYFSPNRQWDGLGLPIIAILPDVIACRLILALRKRVNPTASAVERKHSKVVRDAFQSLELAQLHRGCVRVTEDLSSANAPVSINDEPYTDTSTEDATERSSSRLIEDWA
ncbi:hypothetical protein AX16_008475 [Volvariella volvacea WC 439]|nr:hypothetical protein AX16_008475 [Volvariella volvacea WC 439]